MTSIILKLIYLTIGSGLIALGVKLENLKKKAFIIPILLFIIGYCFAFWGISSWFHTSEGYPPEWFFYVTTMPVWAVVFWAVISIKKK